MKREQLLAKYCISDAASQALKINSCYFKKDPEGNISGEIEFERNGKFASANFGVYASGNWSDIPWQGNSALKKVTPAEKAMIVKAIKAKAGPVAAKLRG